MLSTMVLKQATLPKHKANRKEHHTASAITKDGQATMTILLGNQAKPTKDRNDKKYRPLSRIQAVYACF